MDKFGERVDIKIPAGTFLTQGDRKKDEAEADEDWQGSKLRLP